MKKKNKENYRVGVLQLAFSADVNKNLKKAVEWVKKAAKQGAEIVCLPELYRSQYFCQKEDTSLFDLAETIPGTSSLAFQKVAKENKVSIIVPIFEKRANGLYHNTAIIIDSNGKILGTYRKMHIPDDPA
ncbi:MAG: nitrilase-related carbon-nitrogen hydrolase, partial [Ignavibacteria bacterium]|nr:nitrilase-related carbon-nitrogen hydrolase [Ignavibacteria bacterium]